MAMAASVVDIVEHPLLLDMPGLLENATAEAEILEGLIDLQYNNYSDLYFLFTGSFASNLLLLPNSNLKPCPNTHGVLQNDIEVTY